jgi:magnesium-transporting ATPase (P-type)
VTPESEEPAPTPNYDDGSDEDSDDVTADDVVRIEALEPAFQEFIHGASLNNMASIHKPLEGQGWDAHGDPTEVALQVFAHKAGRGKPHL